MVRKKDHEASRTAAAKIARAVGPAKARILQEELKARGMPMGEAIFRLVVDWAKLGENATDDQVRALAASLTTALGVRAERFVLLWREERDRRRR